MNAYGASDLGSVLGRLFFFFHQVCNGCAGHKMPFILLLRLSIYLLSFFTHSTEQVHS
jgi:hypothetical protein